MGSEHDCDGQVSLGPSEVITDYRVIINNQDGDRKVTKNR